MTVLVTASYTHCTMNHVVWRHDGIHLRTKTWPYMRHMHRCSAPFSLEPIAEPIARCRLICAEEVIERMSKTG